jgi:hypothetical protein
MGTPVFPGFFPAFARPCRQKDAAEILSGELGMQRDEEAKVELSEVRHGYHLIPFAIVAGVAAPQGDERLIGAQSAMNRIQVRIGDLAIDFAAWRKRRNGVTGSTDLKGVSAAQAD